MSTSITNNLSVYDVEGYNADQLVTYLQRKNFGLNEDEINSIRNNVVTGYNFLKLNKEMLVECGIRLGARASLVDLINTLNNQKQLVAELLTLEQALSCVPLPARFRKPQLSELSESSKKRKSSKSATKSGDHVPKDVLLWDGFLEEVNKYEFVDPKKHPKPQFTDYDDCVGEMSVQAVFETNICVVLNKLLKPDYDFTRERTTKPGDPDFTCHYKYNRLLMPIEIKPEYLLETGEKQFPEFYKSSAIAKAVIKQTFSYMVETERQYGILSTYDKHWFLKRPKDDKRKLLISDTLLLESESPPVLKAYAYMAQISRDDYFSPHLLKIPVMEENKESNEPVCKRTRYQTKKDKNKFSNNDYNNSSSSYNTLQKNPKQNLSFMDFKFNGMLGEGRSGKTLKCEFRGITIALKCADLWKSPPYILKEMQNEVNIYQILSTIQGVHIPKLVCHGYYGGGMCYVIGTAFVGTPLTNYKYITERQRLMGLFALNAIHSKGLLHKDIRKENILLSNTTDNVYLIDFGMASYNHDVKKFDEEKWELAQLLNQYILLDSVII